MKNISITGLPRSGTTLTCFLLNKIDNVVALNEPFVGYKELKDLSRKQILLKMYDYFELYRDSIIKSKLAYSMHRGGEIPSNSINNNFTFNYSIGNFRKSDLTLGQIKIEKELSSSFCLAIKDPSIFSALLPEITSTIPTFGIVRNPLATLLSWNSVEFNISKGRLPLAEIIDKDLYKRLNQQPNIYERQGIIFNWFFTKYLDNLHNSCIIKYEDIISSRGQILSKMGLDTTSLVEELTNQNFNIAYDRTIIPILFDIILKYYTDKFSILYTYKEIYSLRDTLLCLK